MLTRVAYAVTAAVRLGQSVVANPGILGATDIQAAHIGAEA